MKGQLRVYPQTCVSASCGRIECPSDCRNLPALREFKEWHDRTDAIREDWIWCPSVWTAQK